MEWNGRHVNATEDEHKDVTVRRELQIPVFGDRGSFNVVRKMTGLEVNGWDSIPRWDYPVRC